ncbi:chloramphenicol phosphotransferase CPT family protein [Aureimonas leprariae]|uniref:Chloramphenicol phosphotransferase n=1 Tax=Plantimonas leprariae TaxID=2615207 RepID=A0A7V7PKR6_9HYPH|nr:chloramphenicol phosphotransferase [Aureimonas leprariae]KAB0676572.1 chloramphenicol phosphotransferase [Aureimonas leprariae]
MRPGRIVVLNGAPRSGKSTIAAAIRERPEGTWIALGVDISVRHMTPPALLPGIGLRPGGERPDVEARLPALFTALYESIAAHSRLGFDVVADLGHHDRHSRPLGILPACARRLTGLPAFLVGVRCPIETIMERRRASATLGEPYLAGEDGDVPLPVALWQEAVHDPGIYDLELDTARQTPAECAEAIAALLADPPGGPTAFERLAV